MTVLSFIMTVEICRLSSSDFDVLLPYSDYVVVFEFVNWNDDVV